MNPATKKREDSPVLPMVLAFAVIGWSVWLWIVATFWDMPSGARSELLVWFAFPIAMSVALALALAHRNFPLQRAAVILYTLSVFLPGLIGIVYIPAILTAALAVYLQARHDSHLARGVDPGSTASG